MLRSCAALNRASSSSISSAQSAWRPRCRVSGENALTARQRGSSRRTGDSLQVGHGTHTEDESVGRIVCVDEGLSKRLDERPKLDDLTDDVQLLRRQLLFRHELAELLQSQS